MVLVLIWWTRLENSGMKENMMKSSKLINFLKNLKTENKKSSLSFGISNSKQIVTEIDFNTVTTTSKLAYQEGITAWFLGERFKVGISN